MEWLKKLLTNIWFYVRMFFVSLLIPPIINWMFRVGTETGEGIVTMWQAADALSFAGDYLSFFGTVILGAVAVFQTDKANAQTEKANELATQMQKLEQAKFVSMVSLITSGRRTQEVSANQAKSIHKTSMSEYEYFDLSSNEPKSNRYIILDAEIQNDSDYPIVQIGIHPGVLGSSACMLLGMTNYLESAVYIPAREKYDIRIGIPADLIKSSGTKDLSLNIEYTNIFDYRTRARLDIRELGVSSRYPTTTYRLAKYIDVKPEENNEK